MRQGESKRTKRQCQIKVKQLSGTSTLNKRGQCLRFLCCVTLWHTTQTSLLVQKELEHVNRVSSPVCHHMSSSPLKKSHSKTWILCDYMVKSLKDIIWHCQRHFQIFTILSNKNLITRPLQVIFPDSDFILFISLLPWNN